MTTVERNVLDSQLQKFKEKNPDVKVSYIYYETEELRSNFQIAALGGSGPDIVYGPSDQVGPFETMKIIKPLEELFDKEYLSKFSDMALTWYKGHLYQIADQIGNHLTLVYNKLLVSNPPKTTSELIEIGKELTKDLNSDGIPDQYALVWNYIEPFFFVPFLGGFGGWIMDEEGNPTLNDSATVKACYFILSLRNEYKIIPKECDYDLANSMFKQGKAAMIINGPWSWAGYKDAGIYYGLAKIPMVSETGKWPTPLVAPKGYSINVNSKGARLKNAIEVVKFLTSLEAELEFTNALNTIPSLKSLQNNPAIKNNEYLKYSMEQLEVGRPMPVIPEMRAIWDAMKPAYQSVINGTITPENAAKNMQEEAIKKIKEMNE
jgi:maltose-binding protein MalE